MDDTTVALLRTLANQRAHVLGIVEGLDDEQLRRPVLPSGWSCLGLVSHLAHDVERFWFGVVMSGRIPFDADEPDAWVVADGVPPESVLEDYRTQIAAADAVITTTPLGAAPAWWPDFFGDFRLADLRAVLLHVIVETACHAGHLDAARELADGRQWLVLG